MAGDPVAREFLHRLTALVPEQRYSIELRSEDAALALLTFGGAALSVLARPCTRDELVPYRKIVRSEPLLIPVAEATPWEIYLHADNPLSELKVSDLPRVFHTGHPAGDLRRWSQLGVTGPLAGQRIETMARPRHRHFLTGGVKDAAVQVELSQPHDHPDDVAAARVLAANPAGLLVAHAGLEVPGVRPLGLFTHLPRFLNFVLNQDVSGLIEKPARILTEAALSAEGQALTTGLSSVELERSRALLAGVPS